MVHHHHSRSWRQISSILRNSYSCNCIQNQDMESQIIPQYEKNIVGSLLRDSIVVADNNNYLTSVIDTSGDSDSQSSGWSSNFNWTRKAPLIPGKFDSNSSSSHRLCLALVVTFMVTLALVVIGSLFITKYIHFGNSESLPTPAFNSTQVKSETSEVILSTIPPKIRKANLSKLAWLALQKNEARDSEGVSDPTQLSFSKDKVHRIPCGSSPSRTPCCKISKSTEVLEHDGCNPIEVPKNTCVGGCDYVFLEGNPYVSIPKCQPVRTRKLKLKLSCGYEVRRITIEIVSRCGCA